MTVTLTWLGQSGFVLADDRAIVAVDPFLSPHELRLHEPPPLDTLPDRVDAVLATHGHLDHLDLAGLAAWVEALDLAEAIGADRVVPCHHDMIRGNTAAVADIVQAAKRPGTRVHLVTPERGVAVELGRRGPR
jgi:L-ascorbate metabolism protein UlaG (beta-lactamase superfamily)